MSIGNQVFAGQVLTLAPALYAALFVPQLRSTIPFLSKNIALCSAINFIAFAVIKNRENSNGDEHAHIPEETLHGTLTCFALVFINIVSLVKANFFRFSRVFSILYTVALVIYYIMPVLLPGKKASSYPNTPLFEEGGTGRTTTFFPDRSDGRATTTLPPLPSLPSSSSGLADTEYEIEIIGALRRLKITTTEELIAKDPIKGIQNLAWYLEGVNQELDVTDGTFVLDVKFEDQEGVDDGGLSRHYLYVLMREVLRKKEFFKPETGTSFFIPQMSRMEGSQDISDHFFFCLGQILMILYRQSQSPNVHEERRLVLGKNFRPPLFNLFSLRLDEFLPVSYDYCSEKEKLNIAQVMYCQELVPSEIMDALRIAQQHGELSDEDFNKGEEILDNVLQDMIEDNTVWTNYQQKPVEEKKGELRGMLIRGMLGMEQYGEPFLRAGYTIAQGGRSVVRTITGVVGGSQGRSPEELHAFLNTSWTSFLHWENLRLPPPTHVLLTHEEKTSRLAKHMEQIIQGTINRQNIVDAFVINNAFTLHQFPDNRHFFAMVGWLKEWVLHEATEEEIKQFLKFSMGSPSLSPGTRITIVKQFHAELAPLLVSHTCSSTLELCDRQVSALDCNNYTKEGFVKCVQVSIKVGRFDQA